MESSRFDALTRVFAAGASRRRTLGALAALAAAPFAADAQPKPNAPQPAACLTNGKRCSQKASEGAGHGKGKRGKGKHHPPSCDKCCSRYGAAGANGKPRCACKSEGIACDNPSQCCSGQCRDSACTACPPDAVFCPDGCANLQTDKHHCGSCTNACASGQRCQTGQCVCDAQSCPDGCCDQDGACQRGTSDQACGNGGAACATCQDPAVCHQQACCSPQCTSTNCGASGRCGGTCVCPDGQRCDNGSCVCDATSCPKGCCHGNTCVPFDDQDHATCGAGGVACGACTAEQVCCGGCRLPCGINETCEGGQCVCGDLGVVEPKSCCPNRADTICGIETEMGDPGRCAYVPSCPDGTSYCEGTCVTCCPDGTTCDQVGGFCRPSISSDQIAASRARSGKRRSRS